MSDKKIYENQTLNCRACGAEFVYTVSEQKFFEGKGFGAPIRCQNCRDAKKARNVEREERVAKQAPKAFQVDADKDWVAAMLERWESQKVEFSKSE